MADPLGGGKDGELAKPLPGQVQLPRKMFLCHKTASKPVPLLQDSVLFCKQVSLLFNL